MAPVEGGVLLGLLLGVTLANLATRLHSCNLFALIPVQYVIIPSSLLLLRRRLSVSARTLAVPSVLDFPCFFRVNLPYVLCVGFSLRVELCFFGIVCWRIFSCSTVDYFPGVSR